jgi:DNA-binding transcriptional LysR family regulator
MPLPARVSDLTSFELLLGVADTGSIGRAAAAHGMSQPAASARLRSLERHLGVRLLERRPRGTLLTTAGELVAGWARPVMARAADLEAGITALAMDRDSQLTVAASLTIAEYLLPRWLIALRATRPDTVTALVCGSSTEVVTQILTGEADLGFVESPTLPRGVRACDVGRDELAIVVSPSHPWARRSASVAAADLAKTPMISREPGSGTRQTWERAVREQLGTALPPPVAVVSSTTAIKAATVGGVGPAVVSIRAVETELAAGTLVTVTVPGLDLTRRLHAIWPEGDRLRGPAADLLAIAVGT